MKPIGYWLNRTDQALTTAMDSVLAEFGLTRLGWQVLGAVRDEPGTTDTLRGVRAQGHHALHAPLSHHRAPYHGT
ncbi:hypothetical protein [Streptomyces sp. NPDC031705]|uniref:hypothetical protein n=1 Tax=Streptomyces sp. NPDC031705 TaxID=3155729 RepID=UPI0033C02627